MKQRKNFTKRLLTFALSLAMVLTSVNIPTLTVYAEVGDESVVLEDETGAVDQDVTVETGDTDETEDQDAIDETGDTDETENPDASVETGDTDETEDADATDETGDTDETEGTDESEAPEVMDDLEDQNEADIPEDENALEGPDAYEASTYAANASNSKGLNGATYKNGTVTFWITTEDEHYDYVSSVYYKAYATKEAAEEAFIGNNGNSDWLNTTGAVPLTENVKTGEKTYQITVNKDLVGAYLYYFPTDGGEHAVNREEHEHIIVINEEGVNSAKLPPDVPQGLTAKFWDDENALWWKLGRIYVAWKLEGEGSNVAGYKVKIDDGEYIDIGMVSVSEYFFVNNFPAGEHTIKLLAYNADGTESGAASCTFNLTEDQAYGGKYAELTNLKTALKDLVEKEKPRYDNGNTDPKKYTDDTWSKYYAAMQKAYGVLNKNDANVDEVKEALEGLQNAIDNLVLASKEQLKEVIGEYEKKYPDEDKDKYPDNNWKDFKDALDKAKDVAEDKDATEDEIDEALKNLKDAADNLENEKKKDIDDLREDLKKAIEKYEQEYPTKDKDEKENKTEDKYTPDSWKDLQDEIEEAKKVRDDEDATEEDLKNALEELEDAVKDLVKKPTKDNLKDAIDKYDKLDKVDYTEDSWDEFKDALDKAKEVNEDKDATEDEIEDALKKLEDAANGLVPRDREGLWIQEIPSQTYTGSAIKPAIRVYEGTKLLEEKTDYTVSYKNNTKVGTAQVTVKGKRDYGKTKIVTFKIKQKRISDADVTAADVFAVISKQNTVKDPKVTIKYGNKTLKNNTDYTLGWPNYKDEDQGIKSGSYEINVTGLGNYKGTKTIRYTIYPMPDSDAINMSKVKVELSSKTVVYAGGDTKEPEVTVTYKGAPIDSSLYDVSYLNSKKVGKATVTVSAKLHLENAENAKSPKNKYYGSKSVTYTVTGTPLNKKNLLIKDGDTEIKNMSYTYTGSEIKVKNLKVYDVTKAGEENKGLLLVEGKDYDIAYSKNINAGKAAAITLTGKNGYTGKFVQKFTIGKKNLGVENDPDLVWNCDQTVAYTKSKAVPQCAITYKGVTLREKKDYTVKCANNNATGKKATITITGKGNYEGTKKFDYDVIAPNSKDALYVADIAVPKNVAKLKTSVKVYEKSTGKALKAGTDYDKNSIKLYVEVDKSGNGGTRNVIDTDLKAGQEIKAEITLKGNYEPKDSNSKATYTFYLYDNKVATFKVLKVATQEYTGKEVTPKLTVQSKDGKTTMKKDVDYKVVYSNNIERGKGKATVTGISDRCRGVKTVTFKIGTRNLSTPGNWFKEVKAATQNLINVVSDFFSK